MHAAMRRNALCTPQHGRPKRRGRAERLRLVLVVIDVESDDVVVDKARRRK